MNFTPQQKYSLLTKMGYQGSLDDSQMENFLASNPGAAAKMGKFDRALSRGFATGGSVEDVFQQQKEYDQQLAQAKQTYQSAEQNLQQAKSSPFAWMTGVGAQQAAFNAAKSNLETLQTQSPTGQAQKKLEVAAAVDPSAILQQQDVAQVQPAEGTTIEKGAGQVTGTPQATAVTAEAQQTETPEEVTASTMEAKKAVPEVTEALEDVQAATAEPSKEATVQGQLESLMSQFEGGATPPWASGAMRQAMSIMQQRGLGASSMAGMAVTQAAMESAIAIAERDASTVAQFEMQNLSNEQQTTIFKTQQTISSILTDQAAENASRQFNASSENQTKTFMANLEAQSSQFNAAQVNAIRQFNAGQTNAIEQFNAEIQNQRDQFNAKNALIIAQANAQWRQNIETVNTAQQNEANRQYTTAINGLTAASLDNYWQKKRDDMSFAFQASENQKTRATNLMIAQLRGQTEMAMQQNELKASDAAGLGSLAATALFGGRGSGGILGPVVSGIGKAIGGLF